MEQLAALAERVIKSASERGLRLATAESCTAGCLATLLADAPGASEQFLGGFVVYAKEQKTAVLSVPAELIETHTAVSASVAKAMAAGVLQHCPADLGVAITGVAGPEPDEDDHPVGLMHIAIAQRSGDICHRRVDLVGTQQQKLRADAIRVALVLVNEVLAKAASKAK